MSRESELDELTQQAYTAFRSGQAFFAAKIKLGAWNVPNNGELTHWSQSLQAVESAGWVLQEWCVATDAGGGVAAFPVFRRGGATPTTIQDQSRGVVR